MIGIAGDRIRMLLQYTLWTRVKLATSNKPGSQLRIDFPDRINCMKPAIAEKNKMAYQTAITI